MLINVQFLRFLAAMLVVVYHSSAHLRASGLDQGTLFAWSEAVGFAGVDIFFVISGFIMAYTTQKAAGKEDGWAFFRRRCARIYSGYWPFFLLALAVFAWANPQLIESADLLRSAILWPANNLLLAVSWTLIFEMFFYLVFTLLVILTTTKRGAVLKVLFSFIVCWSVYSQFFRHAYDPGQLEHILLFEYYALSPYLAEFLAGALLAIRIHTQPAGKPWIPLFVGAMLFAWGGWLNNDRFGGNIEQGYFVFHRVLVFGTASVLILAGLVRLEGTAWKAPFRFSVLAGGASYAIYLSHTLILTVTQHLGFNTWAGHLTPVHAQISFLALAMLILLFCLIYYQWIERPLHGVFKTLFGLNPPRVPTRKTESR